MDGSRPEIIRKKRHSAFMRFRIRRRVRGALALPPRHAKYLQRFEAGIEGTLPSAGAQGVTLAACDNYYYRNFAESLILSIERQGKPEAFHLHLCAPSTETLRDIGKLASSLKDVSLTWTADRCDLAEGLVHRTIYYAASRFLVAHQVLEVAKAPLLCIDVDGIAVKPLWSAYQNLRPDADVLVIRRPEELKATRKILASAVGIEYSQAGRRFAACLAHALAAIFPLRPAYHIDQIAIYSLINEMSERMGLRVADMPLAFSDHDFVPDSVIWTAKGWMRKDSEVYKRAQQEVEAFWSERQSQTPHPHGQRHEP